MWLALLDNITGIRMLYAAERLNAPQGRPSGVLPINAARISIEMVLRPLLAGFLKGYPSQTSRVS